MALASIPKRRTKSAHTQSETDATTAGSSDARQVSSTYGAFEDDSLLVDFANTVGYNIVIENRFYTVRSLESVSENMCLSAPGGGCVG